MKIVFLAGAWLLLSSATSSYCPEGHECVSIGVPRELTPEEEREIAARNARTQAERDRRQKLLEIEIRRLGAHRRAEAERIIAEREAAEKARAPIYSPAASSPPKYCYRSYTDTVTFSFHRERVAESQIASLGPACARDGKVRQPTSQSVSCVPNSNAPESWVTCTNKVSCPPIRVLCTPAPPARATAQ